MIKVRSFTSCIFIILFVRFCHGKLSPHIKVCSRNDPNIEQCISDTVTSLKDHLKVGDIIEGFKMPSIDPFTYDDFVIDHGPTFKTEVKDLKTWNGSNFNTEKLKFNPDKLTFDFIVSLPYLKLTAKYKLNAKLPLIDLSGNGNMITHVKDSKMRMKLYAKLYEKNGSKYATFDKINLRIVPGHSKITLTNLFNGDPTLGKIGNQVVNENQDLFVGEIVPMMEKNFSKVFLEVANKIMESATYDELLPDL